ncbi:hypothetical protein CEXT_648091 [Caerostris extrusa]|uniref:Uncharacterized protein n=1 Tax=Caerostris extrusa TaxID=172846 RepID=A0AAV4XW05_CAEEX|nr:hypothetical protein CEXT_648091 [Caerostris extrusa]
MFRSISAVLDIYIAQFHPELSALFHFTSRHTLRLTLIDGNHLNAIESNFPTTMEVHSSLLRRNNVIAAKRRDGDPLLEDIYDRMSDRYIGNLALQQEERRQSFPDIVWRIISADKEITPCFIIGCKETFEIILF